jgi:uncharacterized protein (DUF2267 family)
MNSYPYASGAPVIPIWRRRPFVKKDNHRKSMNFERYAAEGNRFVNEVANELQTDRAQAARITRAVLHAIRDRLPPGDAIEFAQGLPMVLKGVYFDRYDLSGKPLRIRDKHVFIEFVRRKAGTTMFVDFPGQRSVIQALQAVFYVLKRNMSYGQIHQLRQLLNRELLALMEGSNLRVV